MIDSEGLRGYIDPECLQNELSEVTGMTEDDMNEAAHELLSSQATGARESSLESDVESNHSWLPANVKLRESDYIV